LIRPQKAIVLQRREHRLIARMQGIAPQHGMVVVGGYGRKNSPQTERQPAR